MNSQKEILFFGVKRDDGGRQDRAGFPPVEDFAPRVDHDDRLEVDPRALGDAVHLRQIGRLARLDLRHEVPRQPLDLRPGKPAPPHGVDVDLLANDNPRRRPRTILQPPARAADRQFQSAETVRRA